MTEQRFENCPVGVAYAERAFFFGNVAKRVKTDGLKEMRCVVNYWPFTVLYVLLAAAGLCVGMYLSVVAAETIGLQWSAGMLLAIFGGILTALSVWITDAMALKFSSMKVVFTDNKIVINGKIYDLINDIYDIRKSPLSGRKITVYGLREKEGKAIPWIFRLTFLRESQAHFFVRYVEHLHMQAATGATKEQSDNKDRNAHDT